MCSACRTALQAFFIFPGALHCMHPSDRYMSGAPELADLQSMGFMVPSFRRYNIAVLTLDLVQYCSKHLL